ncbi:MAG: hypothetical protein QXL15_02110 [Candidatus Korarchaeota archaeon]
MEYNPNALPVLISLGCISVLVTILSIATTLKYFQKRTRIALALSCGVYFTALAIIVTFVGEFDWFLSQYFSHEPYFYLYRRPFGYTFLGLAVLSFVWFSVQVFSWKRKYLWINVAIVIVMLIMVYYPYTWFAQVAPGGALLRTLTRAVIFLYSSTTITRIGINAVFAAKRASTDVIRKNFIDIATAMFTLLLGFIFYLFDVLASVILGWDYNVFAWLNWWCIGIGLYFLYRGFYTRSVT